MPTERIAITCPNAIHHAILEMLRNHPPALPDGRTPVVEVAIHEASDRLTALAIDLIYPEPEATIPELIRRWHAEPTGENRERLWEAIRKHGHRHERFCESSYMLDGQRYVAMGGMDGFHVMVTGEVKS